MGSDRHLWKVVLDRYQSVNDFLPCLIELETFHHTLAEDTLFTHSLLTHTLKHISIDLDILGYPEPPNGGALLTAALERVADAVPSLTSLTVCFVTTEPPQYRQIPWKMPTLKSIQKLDISYRLTVGASVLTTIGQFEHLRTLFIHVIEDCGYLRGRLQALTELTIYGRASNIHSFLRATSPPHLQSLTIAFLHDPNTELVEKCMSALPTLVPRTLSALALESQLDFTPKLASALALLQPALAFSALTHFSLALVPLPSLSDADVAAMAAAWPALTTLRIAHDHGYAASWRAAPAPKPARPTTRVFPIIAARCPRLTALELPEVDLAALDMLPPSSSPARHPLRTLKLHSDSKFQFRDACALTAEMLDRLFPSLVLLAVAPAAASTQPRVGGGLFGEREEQGWDAVARMLHEMRAQRAHADGPSS